MAIVLYLAESVKGEVKEYSHAGSLALFWYTCVEGGYDFISSESSVTDV